MSGLRRSRARMAPSTGPAARSAMMLREAARRARAAIRILQETMR